MAATVAPLGELTMFSGKPTPGYAQDILGLKQDLRDKVLAADKIDPFVVRNQVARVTIDGQPLPVAKFDINLINQKSRFHDMYTYDYTFDQGRFYDYYKPFYYQRPHPVVMSQKQAAQYKKLFDSLYTGAGKQAETVPEEAPVEAPEVKRPFRYSKTKAQAYVDSMVFWLTNPFKDDILACAETNS